MFHWSLVVLFGMLGGQQMFLRVVPCFCSMGLLLLHLECRKPTDACTFGVLLMLHGSLSVFRECREADTCLYLRCSANVSNGVLLFCFECWGANEAYTCGALRLSFCFIWGAEKTKCLYLSCSTIVSRVSVCFMWKAEKLTDACTCGALLTFQRALAVLFGMLIRQHIFVCVVLLYAKQRGKQS